MESSLKQLTLRPIRVKLSQDARSSSKHQACVLVRCNSSESTTLLTFNSDSVPKVEYMTLKGLEGSPINIKVYRSEIIAQSNLVGELNLLFGALALEHGTQQDWKQLTKLGRKTGEILLEIQTESRSESDESFYSSKSNPDLVNKDSSPEKTPQSDQNKEANKSSIHHSSQEASADQKQIGDGNLSDSSRNRSDVSPNQISDNSIVSVESNNQKLSNVNTQADDKTFQPFKGLEQLSNGGGFFKSVNANQDIYLDILEAQEKPVPKKPMGVAKWMVYLSQLVNPSLNY